MLKRTAPIIVAIAAALAAPAANATQRLSVARATQADRTFEAQIVPSRDVHTACHTTGPRRAKCVVRLWGTWVQGAKPSWLYATDLIIQRGRWVDVEGGPASTECEVELPGPPHPVEIVE